MAVSTSGDRATKIFQRRDFRSYLGATFLASLASTALSVAISWQVYDIAREPLALGYVGLSQFLPMALLTLPAGDLADRFNRRSVLALGVVLQAGCAGLFLTLAWLQSSLLWPYYLVLVLFGTARVVAQPAGQSLLPLLVAPDQFPEAVAWSSSARQTAVIAGPALGGAIYMFGPFVAYGVCLALYLGVVAAVLAIRTQSTPEVAVGASALTRLIAGAAYVSRRAIILGAISLDLFAVLLGGATALLPVYARDILHVGPAGLGLLRSAPAAGAAVLGFLLVRLPLRRNSGLMMFAGVAVFGLATIVFGLSRNFRLSMTALIVLGASDMVSVYVRSTLIQLATPDPMRGRVSAVNYLFIGASNELGEFESGVTADWFGTVPSVVIGGLGTLVVVGLWMALFPSLRRVDDLAAITPEEMQPPAAS